MGRRDGTRSTSIAGHRGIRRALRRVRRLRLSLADRASRKSIHGYRVAWRQLEAAVVVFGPAVILPHSVTPRGLVTLGRGTGAVRDLDVVLRLVRRMAEEAPSANLTMLRKQAKGRRRRRVGILRRHLRSSGWTGLVGEIRHWVDTPRFTGDGNVATGRAATQLLESGTAQLIDHPAWRFTDAAAVPELFERSELHQLRTVARTLRYQVEAVDRECGGQRPAQIAMLRTIQDLLGRLHDVDLVDQAATRLEVPLQASQLAELNRLRRDRWQAWLEFRIREGLLPDGRYHTVHEMNPSKVDRRHVRKLTDLPNVGPATAKDLMLLGITAPEQLVGQDAYDLYDRLCRETGVRHDPCVIDVFLSVTGFMAGDPPAPWWDYTPARKKALSAG